MAKRMQELIEAGLVEDGELLRYKSKKGQVLALGRAREGGIEVEGKAKLLGFTAFEAVAGSGYHRPALHTHTIAGRNLQELQLQAAGVEAAGGPGVGSRTRHAQQAEQEAAAVQLLEDENDDLCHICGLPGDLVCCETCPAVYHAACVGLPGAPEGDYHCPRCCCTTCGKGGSEGAVPTGCQWVDCQAFVGPDTLQQQPKPFAGTSSGGSSGVKLEPAAAAAGEAAAAAGGPEPMQVDGAAAPGTANFSRLVAAASAAVLQGGVPAEAAEAAPAAQAAAAEAPGSAAVHCPVTGRWSHLGCFPAQFAEQLRHVAYTQPCISSPLAATTSQRLAAVCAAGLLPLGSIAEGARPAGAGAGGAAADASSGDGFAPLPLSLLVVRGAAVASPADCRGHSPAYAPEQRQQLQVALSAALHVLHSCYDPLPDSRTGADMLPWLLRGAVLAGGRADYSATHTALLYAGCAVVGVAVFRCFGEIAELPLLAVRPELQQHNGLGRLLLAAVEQLLLASGAKVLLTPGFAADGSPYLPAPAAGGGPPLQPPPLLQAKWGYALAKPEQLLAACQHPLLRMPGVLLASKALSDSSVLPPPRLPQRLQWAGGPGLDARQLLKQGLVAPVSIPRPAAEPSAAGSRPPRQAGGQIKTAPPLKLDAKFVPTMPPAAAGAGAASATAIGLTVEQSMLLRMYQHQLAAAAAKSHAEIHVAAGPAAIYQQMLLQSAAQQQAAAAVQQAAVAAAAEQQQAGAAAPQVAPAHFAYYLQQQLAGPYAAFLQQHMAAQQQQAQQQQQQHAPPQVPLP